MSYPDSPTDLSSMKNADDKTKQTGLEVEISKAISNLDIYRKTATPK